MSRETVGDEVRSGDLTVEGTVAADSATVSGNVGIGTSSPSAALHVKSAWVTNEGQIQADVPSGGTYSGVTFQNDGTLKGLAVWDNASSRMFLSVPGTTGSVVLGYNSVSPALTMDAATRNVGIGTSSPGVPLHVIGSAIAGRDTTQYLKISGDAGGTYIDGECPPGAGKALQIRASADSGDLQLRTLGAKSITAWTNNTERLRIDTAGLITGSGTSLGAWTAYTPTLGGTGWAIGDGTATGAYCRIGKTVHFWARLAFGSTTVAGTASGTLSSPLNIATYGASFLPGPLQGVLYDASSGVNYFLQPRASTTSAFSFRSLLNTSGQVQNVIEGTPINFASGDTIVIAGTYETSE